MSPFDYLNSISHKKNNLIVDEQSERKYNSFVINRSLSNFPDTALLANVMNHLHHLDKKLQYDFLINTVRPRKRFSKWAKPELDDDIEVVKEYYGYNNEKAKEALSLLSSDQIEELKKKVYKGGRK